MQVTADATATGQFSLARAMRSALATWDLLVAITLRDLSVRYQGTILSYVWWIARPLALGLVLYFALSRVLRLDVPNYGVFLLAALFPWFWFSGSVQQSVNTFIANGGLLKKVRFPRLILPLSAVFYNTIQFLLSIPVLVLFILIAGLDARLVWLAGIPILLVLQLVILIGLSMFVSSINVFFRDLGPFMDVVMRVLFYGTPIIYPLDRVPDRFKPLVMLNPMAPVIEGWRDLFLGGTPPGAELWPAIVFAVVFLVIGAGVFRALEKYFADAL
jgi:lipopolysaccharide transport system permease protein